MSAIERGFNVRGADCAQTADIHFTIICAEYQLLLRYYLAGYYYYYSFERCWELRHFFCLSLFTFQAASSR